MYSKKNWNIFTQGLLATLILFFSPFVQGQTKPGETNKTGTEQNKKLVLRFFDEVFNQQSLAALDELYAADVLDHTAFPDQAPGVEGIRAAIEGFFEFFDGLSVTVEEVVAEGDKVVTRETWRGIHKPSGKIAEGSVIHIFRLRHGKITDEWSKGWDWLEDL